MVPLCFNDGVSTVLAWSEVTHKDLAFLLMVVTDLATMMVTAYVSSASAGREGIVLYDGCSIKSCMSVLTSL